MQFHFTGKNIDVTDAMAIYATEKLAVLEHRDNNIMDVHVILMVEHTSQIAEATLKMPGTTLHAKAESEDMYQSIKDLADKLITQVTKHKDRTIDSHRG